MSVFTGWSFLVLASLNPVEVWSLELKPADLYNIERSRNDNPRKGGGHTYIQIPAAMVRPTLKFLRAGLPGRGQMIILPVKDPNRPQAPAQEIRFMIKSYSGNSARMRIARQNRHRPSSMRPTGWSQAAGFPVLPLGHTTAQAKVLLNGIGGLRVFLARDANGDVWAGSTQGSAPIAEQAQPYAKIAWAPSKGGLWP